jgi:type I restriction enzyme S subunit
VSLSSYPKLKPLRVEGWEAAPEHWRETRLRFVVRVNPPKSELDGCDENTEVSFLPMEAIGEDGSLVLDARRRLGDVKGGYTYFRDGDVAVAKITPCFENGKGALMHDLEGGVGFGTTELIVVRPVTGLTSSTFVYWLLASIHFRRLGEGAMYGAGGQKRVPDEFVRNFPVALPPVAEQAAIAAFLDRETAKIDALVEEQKRLIELLKEKRQSVISHAVTKGLNPDAPMKDSGVEWLGQVPEHWSVVPTGHRYEVQLGRMLNEGRARGEDLRCYLRVADVQWGRINTEDLPLMNFPPEVRKRYRLRPGDLLINEGGSYVGRSAIWRGELSECYYQKALHRLRPRNDRADITDFFYFVMEQATQIGVFIAGGNQTTIDHLTAEQLRRNRFAFPPREEQVAIAEFLTEQTAKIENLIFEVEAAIGHLLERRSTLISAAVTGKIDVRYHTAGAQPKADRARVRLVVGTAIIEALAHRPNFGRTKAHKIAYLAEAHAGVHELGGAYLREAAGPLDRSMIDEMEARLQQVKHISVEQPEGPGSQVNYEVLGQRGAYRDELRALLGSRADTLDRLIADLADLDTRHVEAVATLYAVWNDALIDGDKPTDDAIVLGVLHDWHPEKKKKFRADELCTWLGWMRRHELVPRGERARTSTRRLLI